MRPICIVRLEKSRPAVVLTREVARSAMSRLTVAPITSTVRGVASEVSVGPENGLDHASVVSCDNVQTVRAAAVGRIVGYLSEQQEVALAEALINAFDLRVEDVG